MQMWRKNSVTLKIDHPVNRWMQEQAKKMPELGSVVDYTEWPSFVKQCPNPTMGLDPSRQAFQLKSGKVVFWDPEAFFQPHNLKEAVACVKMWRHCAPGQLLQSACSEGPQGTVLPGGQEIPPQKLPRSVKLGSMWCFPSHSSSMQHLNE